MSDACYELFEANIEGARAFSRIILIEIGIARLKTSWVYFHLLLEIRKYFKIMRDLFEKSLNTDPHTVIKHPIPDEDLKKGLEDALGELKKTAQDCLRIKQELMAIMKKWSFIRVWYPIVLGNLPDKLLENIETLYFVIEAALEEEGEYVTADEILASLS